MTQDIKQRIEKILISYYTPEAVPFVTIAEMAAKITTELSLREEKLVEAINKIGVETSERFNRDSDNRAVLLEIAIICQKILAELGIEAAL